MPELAVIINHVGEYPHLHYTLQSVWMELRDSGIDFEVICVDNDCGEARQAGYEPGPTPFNIDDSMDYLTNGGKYTPWLRRIKYDKKLSHWAAKNYAVKNTDAPFLFFLDAHCLLWPGSLANMFKHYTRLGERYWSVATLHLPISDFLRPDFVKRYSLIYRPDHGVLHYENVRLLDRLRHAIVGVPAQSTCGMLSRREHITDVIGFWPDELGPYGGGENYFNFCMALMGYSKHIYPSHPIYHWHIPGGHWSRDYTPSVKSWAQNIMIATYLVGGESWLRKLAANHHRAPYPINAIHPDTINHIKFVQILGSCSLRERREWIKERAVTTIEKWAVQWVGGENE